MGRLPKTKTLSEKVLNSEAVDYSDYKHKELIECIKILVAKVNEKEKALLSESQLKAIKRNLESQVKVIEAAIPKPIEPKKDDKSKEDETPEEGEAPKEGETPEK